MNDIPSSGAKRPRRLKPGPGRHGSGRASARTAAPAVSTLSETAPKTLPVPAQRASAEPPAPVPVPPTMAGTRGSLTTPKPTQVANVSGHLSLEDTISVTTALTVLRTPIVILHVETTGPDPMRDEILAIHAIRVDKFRQVAEFGARVLPLRALTGAAEADTDQAGRPPAKRQSVPLQEAITRLLEFLGTHLQHVFVHGSAGTQAFLGQAARQYGLVIENPVGDLVDLAALAWPGRADYSLAALAADVLPELGPIRTASDATKAILAVLQAASKILTATGGRVSSSVVHWGTSEDCVRIRLMPW